MVVGFLNFLVFHRFIFCGFVFIIFKFLEDTDNFWKVY